MATDQLSTGAVPSSSTGSSTLPKCPLGSLPAVSRLSLGCLLVVSKFSQVSQATSADALMKFNEYIKRSSCFVRQSCQTGNAGPARRSPWKKMSDGMGLQGISNISFAGYLRSKEIVLATEQSSCKILHILASPDTDVHRCVIMWQPKNRRFLGCG